MENAIPEREQIAATIDRYFAGLYRSSGEDITASFHPSATITGFRNETGEMVEMDFGRFHDFVTSQLPSPAESGEPFEMTMDSLDIMGRVAMARVTDRYLGKRFTDLLLLAKVDDGWRIYSKLWHAADL